MADWIAKTVARRAPNAIRCADPFHVVAWAIEALDIERRWASASINTLVVPASRPRQRRRPLPWSSPGARRPHRPQRPLALALGRTDTMIASAVSSKRTPSTTVRINPHPRCHTLLFCTLFCSSRFRAFTQRENLEADRLQPASTLPKPPTDRAEERPMCGRIGGSAPLVR